MPKRRVVVKTIEDHEVVVTPGTVIQLKECVPGDQLLMYGTTLLTVIEHSERTERRVPCLVGNAYRLLPADYRFHRAEFKLKKVVTRRVQRGTVQSEVSAVF